MRKIYSIVLMACAMLVSASSFAVTPVTDLSGLQAAINNAATAGSPVNITLGASITIEDTDKPIFVHGGTVNLDLNGHTILTKGNRAIELYSGSLKITGTGTIEKTTSATKADAIAVFGSQEDVPNFSNLTIDENVTIKGQVGSGNTQNINGIVVISDSGTNPGYTDYFGGKAKVLAFGVNIEIKGTVLGPKYGIKINGSLKTDGTNTPYVHIASTAEVYCAPNSSNSTAIYSSGIGRFLIEGYVHGATGVYVKAGTVTVNDAVVKSDFTGAYSEPAARIDKNGKAIASGFQSGGSAITIATDKNYASKQEVTISGDSKVTGSTGYAIEEAIVNGDKSEVSHVTITGGTIEAGAEGGMIVTNDAAEGKKITIVGANVENQCAIKNGDGSVNKDVNIETFIPEGGNYTTTTITNADGKEIVVVTELETGITISKDNEKTIAAAAADGLGLKWAGTSEVLDKTDENPRTVTLPYLEINENKAQTLTVKKDVTLKIGRVVMGAQAQIVVEAGATLIVDGEQGIVATSNDNLVLETKEGKPAIFLFNPAVTSNRHPNATVEFFSKSKVNGNNLVFQRFGVPTYGKPSLITAEYNNNPVQTAFYKYDYQKNAWPKTTEFFGAIHWDGQTMDYDQMKTPFEYYQMLNNNSEMGTIVKIQGNLVGNSNEALAVRGDSWNGFANSYMGKIDGVQLIKLIPETVDKAFYLYDITQDQATWEPKTLLEIDAIDPMQPFLIRNTKSAANVSVDYTKAIYNPALGISDDHAPVRRVASDMTRAKLVVRGEGCIDRVTVAESDMFTAEFDNGYDAAKYMNDGINMYVSADEKMSIYATDNLENTYVGVASVKGGTYSISFEKVAGESLTLIDHETGATVDMTEGNVYEFTVAANTVNDYRFQIVGRAQVATDVENISAANNGAVYTIMGQYVGQMSEWNNLPAGIYVVDGVKRVK